MNDTYLCRLNVIKQIKHLAQYWALQWVCHKECAKYMDMGHWVSRDDNLDSLFDWQLSNVNQVPYYPMEGDSLPSNRSKIALKSV